MFTVIHLYVLRELFQDFRTCQKLREHLHAYCRYLFDGKCNAFLDPERNGMRRTMRRNAMFVKPRDRQEVIDEAINEAFRRLHCDGAKLIERTKARTLKELAENLTEQSLANRLRSWATVAERPVELRAHEDLDCLQRQGIRFAREVR